MLIVSIFGCWLENCRFDFQAISKKFIEKYRVKDNSILRKILHLKDKKGCVYNYFMVVPMCIFLLLSIITLIIIIVDLASNHSVTNTISENIFLYSSAVLIGINILYYLIIFIWQGIAEYKESKPNKQQIKQEAQIIKEIMKIEKEKKGLQKCRRKNAEKKSK